MGKLALGLILGLCGCGAEGGAQDLSAPEDLAATGPIAAIAATPDLVGFPTRLDGTGSSNPQGRALTFTWHLTNVPAGSALSDASLSSTGGAMVTFEPDRGGDYQIALTVSTPDGSSGTTAARVTVPTLALFYQEGTFTGTTHSSAAGLIRSDGTGRRLVSCPRGADGGAGGIIGYAFNAFHSLGAFDPPVGAAKPALFAFPEAVGGEQWLVVADPFSDCAGQTPPRVDQASDVFYRTKTHFWPRFSPDGNRVLFVDNPESQGTSRLVSVAVDGSGLRVIRTNANLSTAPPVWLDATHVAWVENVGGTAMAPKPFIYSASDASFAGDSTSAPGDRVTLADCSTALPIVNQFAVVPGALIIAGGTARKSAGGALNLYRVTGAACTVAAVLAQEPANGDAGDFSLSPDGVTIAISTTHGQAIPDGGMTPQHDIFLVRADGTGGPTFFAGAPGHDDLGPRWVAGGRQLLWTQGRLDGDGGVSGGGLMLANADGTHVRSIYGQGAAVVIGGSNSGISCAWGGPLSTALGLAPLLFLLAAFALARRVR